MKWKDSTISKPHSIGWYDCRYFNESWSTVKPFYWNGTNWQTSEGGDWRVCMQNWYWK